MTPVRVFGSGSEKHNANSARYTFAVYTGDECFKRVPPWFEKNCNFFEFFKPGFSKVKQKLEVVNAFGENVQRIALYA